jgi:hypothetical protein
MAVRRRHPDGCDDCRGDLLAQATEAAGLAFGGGGHDDRLIGVREMRQEINPIQARLQLIHPWLGYADVEAYGLGPQVELWHGLFGTVDAIAQRLPDR